MYKYNTLLIDIYNAHKGRLPRSYLGAARYELVMTMFIYRRAEWLTRVWKTVISDNKRESRLKVGTPPKNNLISITALEWMSLSFYVVKMSV